MIRSALPVAIAAALGTLFAALPAHAGPPTHVSAAVQAVQDSAESRIRRVIEPLLDKYCRDQCKLLTVSVSADIAVPEETAPGFDEIPAVDKDALAPTSARIKLLFDDKFGTVSRGRLIDLIQQYLDIFDYPIKVSVQVAHFPEPAGSEGRIADLRDKLARNFQETMSELIQQFCPDQCLLTDFNLKTDTVNAEEAQYGGPGEYVQDGNLALRIRDISATLLMDESLSPDDRNNILEMAKLKTRSFHNAEISGKVIRFPRPTPVNGPDDPALATDGNLHGGRPGHDRATLSDSRESKTSSNDTSKSLSSRSDESRKSVSSSEERNRSDINTTKTSQSKNSETNQKQERFERYEKIERVENGDAVQAELRKFKLYALVFGCSILSLLIFIAVAGFRSRREMIEVVNRGAAPPLYVPPPVPADETGAPEPSSTSLGSGRTAAFALQYEISRLRDELLGIFAQNPKVTKYVFHRVLTEEGIEVTAQYMHLFGESIMIEMLRDPSLQSDMNELMEYYARTIIDLKDAESLELLRKLHQRTVAGKLAVMGNRSSNLFDFLAEMDAAQIFEMIRAESLTVKSIILTQCDAQKRTMIYNHLDEETKLRLLAELSRIDYLPRDYVTSVASALKRKRRENPRLNTEALPGSEILVSLLERANTGIQRDVVKTLEATNPESARTIKGKLISVETLRYLRDGQLLEVVLSLKHDELLQFLKGAPLSVRQAVFDRSPPELSAELGDELASLPAISREAYLTVERKILNRMKLMANDGLINLVETNERMFMESGAVPEMTGSYGLQTGRGMA